MKTIFIFLSLISNGFAFSDLKHLQLVRKNGLNIQYLENPSDIVKLEAIKQNPFSLK